MRTHPFALLAAVLLLLISGVGTASASTPVQAVEQAAGNAQSASSSASTTQTAPSNSNIDVRIFSPGSNGDVTQTNAAGSAAVAGNANTTGQTATQQGGATQEAGQAAGSTQAADAEATTEQVKPSNENISVRIGSPGADGDVTQTNAAGSEAIAGNRDSTEQSADQQGGGDCRCSDGEQAVGQGAHNRQDADAEATTEQVKPSNENISVRIGSPGSNGSVDQSNVAGSGAAAGNANATDQSATQAGGGGGVQAIGQEAASKQSADADATTEQIMPSNQNMGVRIHSPGDDGDVTQMNVAGSEAIAGNANHTGQAAEQSQGRGCGCHGGTGVQAVGQWAENHQGAEADATTKQWKPANVNARIAIGDGHGHGQGCGCHPKHAPAPAPSHGGDVMQVNVAGSAAMAANKNGTEQAVDQSQGGRPAYGSGSGGGCGCHGAGVQAVGQFASGKQRADADAATTQAAPSNANVTPADGGGKGHGGDMWSANGTVPAPRPSTGAVHQANLAWAKALSLNLNGLTQEAVQEQ